METHIFLYLSVDYNIGEKNLSNDEKIIEELSDPNFHNKFPSKEEMIKYQNKLVLKQLEKFEKSQR